MRDLTTEVLSAKPEASENEPVIDLKREDFSEKLEDMPTDPTRTLAIFFNSEPVSEVEPVNDLKNELFSVKPETGVSEPPNDRKKDDFQVRSEAEVSESIRDLM